MQLRKTLLILVGSAALAASGLASAHHERPDGACWNNCAGADCPRGDCPWAQDGSRAPRQGKQARRPRNFGGGPATALMTVGEVLKNAADDQKVTVRGRLTEYLGDEKYTFSDDQDSITVKLDDDDDWSFLAKDMPIEIYAKVDSGLMTKKLKVLAARPLPPNDGKPADFGPDPQPAAEESAGK